MRVRALLIAAALTASCTAEQPQQQNQSLERVPPQRLSVLTALPLAWSENFGLEQPGSPALVRLQQDYEVTLVDGPEGLPERGLLLAAQPRALPAQSLVALDRWVRRGGRLVLLADPMLEWESARPLGDPLRPPLSFADTGLLGHWGLTLFAPDDRGPVQRSLGGFDILANSPGELDGRCRIEGRRFVARCRPGRGQVTVIADADFLNVDSPGGIDGPTEHNLDALLAELERLK